MNARSKIFWLIWPVAVIAVIWWFVNQCSGTNIIVYPSALHSPKGLEQVIAKRIAMPLPIVIPPAEIDVFYFAATAHEDMLASEFSNEVVFTNKGNASEITLAWDSSPGDVDGYRIHKGWSSGVYDTTFNSTTNLSQRVWLYHPVLTNCVVTVTSQNATDLQRSSNLGHIWILLGATNWIGTNPPTRYWRAVGRSQVNRPKVFISRKWQ